MDSQVNEKKFSEQIEDAVPRVELPVFSAEEEERLIRKLDRRILPWIMLLYMVR